MESDSHRSEVVSQFTRQAHLFSDHQAHSELHSLEVFRELGAFTGVERVLDSGCGPGLVSCYLQPFVNEIIGVDLTPAMLQLARERAKRKGLSNVTFVSGNMTSLPFGMGEFNAAITRYTFHHLENPAAAFTELVRVTRSGGAIIVLDVTPDVAKRDAYDAFERRRDSSHTQALTVEELTGFGSAHGLAAPETRHFGLALSAASLVASSFPKDEDREALLGFLAADVGQDNLSFQARWEAGELFVTFPLTACRWFR